MDFDDAKENIQPLATGRNASILQASLRVESSQELMAQRHELEQAIHDYNGDDPLEPWYTYISWIEQSYPSGGKESGLDEVMTKCLSRFESEERYYQDRRMIKLYMKFIDSHHQPTECYQQLFNAGIGTMVADFYICWAYHYDLCGNTRKADEIFRRGLACRAQPIEDLQEAHQHFGFSVAQRMMYQDDDSVRENTKRQFEERRLALTSLRGHRRKATVGSIRTGDVVKTHTPGTVQIAPTCSTRQANSRVQVFHDENASPNVLPLAQLADTEVDNATAEDGKSVVRSIISAARNQENMKEPGPWNKAHDKKSGKLFDRAPKTTDLGFSIHEDNDLEMKNDMKYESAWQLPIANEDINYNKPFKFPPNFKEKNVPLLEWNTPVTIENEVDSRTFPQYNKCFLYPRPNMEYQPEELYAFYKLRKRGISNEFTKKRELVWSSRDVKANVRCYPNFSNKSRPQQLGELDTYYSPEKKSGMMVSFKSLYDTEEKVEYQLEELMARRLRRNNTIIMATDMDETMCGLSERAQRRKSFFPTRKSIASKMRVTINAANERLAVSTNNRNELEVIEKTCAEKTTTTPPADVATTSQNLIASSVIDAPAQSEDSTISIETVKSVIPFEIFEDTTIATSKTTATVSESLPIHIRNEEAFGPDFKFKTPAVPATGRTNKLAFEIYSETSPVECGAENVAGFLDAEETCSTQTFNIFLKSQSVSTPKVAQKTAPRLFGTLLKSTHNPAEQCPDDISPIAIANIDESDSTVKIMSETPGAVIGQPLNTEYSPLNPKQLSTILETSEHGTTQGTHNTVGATTKSTSSSSEGDGEQVVVRLAMMPLIGLETLEEQSRELSTVPADVIASMANIKLQCDPQSKSIVNDMPKQQLQQSIQSNCSSLNTPANLRLQPTAIGQGTAIPVAGALNFSIFEDEPTVDIIKTKQAGNFTRLDEPEDTSTALAIRSVRFQEDKTETIPKMLLNSRSVVKFQEDKTETMSKILLAPPTLAQFEAEKADTMPKLPLESPLLPAVDFTNLDDSFEFFRQTPPGRKTLKTLKADMPAYLELKDARSPLVSAAKRLCDKVTPVMQLKCQTTRQQYTNISNNKTPIMKAQPLFGDEIVFPQTSSACKETSEVLTQDINNSIKTECAPKMFPRAISRDSFMPDFSFIEETQPAFDKEQKNNLDMKAGVNVLDDASKLFNSYLGDFSMVKDVPQKCTVKKVAETSDFIMDSQPPVSVKKSQMEAEEHQMDTNQVHSYIQDNFKNKTNAMSTGANAKPNDSYLDNFSMVMDSQPQQSSFSVKKTQSTDQLKVQENQMDTDQVHSHMHANFTNKLNTTSAGTNANANDSYLEHFSIVMDSQPQQNSSTKTNKTQLESQKAQEFVVQSNLRNSYIHDFSATLDAQPQITQPARQCRLSEAIVKTKPASTNKRQTTSGLRLGNSFLKDFSVVMESQAENRKLCKQKSTIAKSEIQQQSKCEKINNINESYLKDFSIAMESHSIKKESTEEANKSIANKSQPQQAPIFLESFMRDFSIIQEPPKDPIGKSRLTFLNESKKLHESTQGLLNNSTKAASITSVSKALPKLNFLEVPGRECNAPAEMGVTDNKRLSRDEFFEYNAETEMFAASNSMIKNSTWLPSYETCEVPQQIQEQSMHIKSEPTDENAKEPFSNQLNIFEFKTPKLSAVKTEPNRQIKESTIDRQSLNISTQNSTMRNRTIEKSESANKKSLDGVLSGTSTRVELKPETATFAEMDAFKPPKPVPSEKMCINITNNQSMNMSMQNSSMANRAVQKNVPSKPFDTAVASRISTKMELAPETAASVESDINTAQSVQNENMCFDITNNQSINTSTQGCAIKNHTVQESKTKKSIGAAISRTATQMEIVEEAESTEKDDDAELSIYYKNTPKTPKIQNHIWSEDSPSPKTPTNNKYVHPDVDLNVTNQIIDDMFMNPNGNPFNSHLQSAFLEQIDFSNYINELPNCMLVGHVSRLHSSLKIKVNDEEIEVLKLLGEGAYGVVFCGINHKTGTKYALKQERPPNFWEYYICLEVQSRLSIDLLPAYMSVDYALFGNNCSILVSHFSPYGSIINVCNTVKRYTSKNVDEYLVMLLTCELLDIIDHLHAIGIIHADIKPDNFLLMKKLEYPNTQRALQLIDFGVSVDMNLFKPGQTFTYRHHQDAFKCVEMREGKPWTYQLDLYGLAGVIHVLLFGKFMEIEQSVNGFWMHKTHVPRYFNKPLWNTIFQTLLNIRNCESMPNLQRLRALLKEELVEKEKFVVRKINDFNIALTA